MLTVHYVKQYDSDIADCIRATWSVSAAVPQMMLSVMKLLKHRGVYNLLMCLRNSCQLGKQIPVTVSHCLFRMNRACKYELILLQLYNIFQVRWQRGVVVRVVVLINEVHYHQPWSARDTLRQAQKRIVNC